MWDLLLFKYRARPHRHIRFMYGRVQPRHPIQIVFWPAKHAFWADGPLGSNPCPINGNWRGSRDKCREQGLSHLSHVEIGGAKGISQHLSGLILHRFNSSDLFQLQDGDVGVGVLPEREEIFVGGELRAASASASCEVLAFKAFAQATPGCARRSCPAIPLLFHPCQNLRLGSGIPASLLQKAGWVIVVPSILQFVLGLGGSPICKPDSRTTILKTENH